MLPSLARLLLLPAACPLLYAPAPAFPARSAQETPQERVSDGRVFEILTEERTRNEEPHWVEERISAALSAGPLLELRRLLLGPDDPRGGDVDPLAIFTDDARFVLPVPAGSSGSSPAAGVTVRVFHAPGADSPGQVALDDWLDSIAQQQAGLRRVRWALVKPAFVERTDFGARVELKWYWNRELDGGGLVHDRARFLSEWVPPEDPDEEDAWRCRRLEPLPGGERLASLAPHFVETTLESLAGTGLDPRIPTSNATRTQPGLALADLDADGHLDLVTTVTDRVLFGRGDGTFEDRTDDVLVGPRTGFGGVLVADFDRDGDLDLVMGGRGRATIALQERGRFRTRQIDVALPRNRPASLAAHDVDGDGWLDVFLCGYGPFVDPGPDDFTAATNGYPNQMLRGLPGGEFEDVTEAWGLAAERTRWTFVGAFGDPDDDGDADLYTSNDFGPNVLYRCVSRDPVRFEAEVEDVATIDSGFSMSATWADLDGDLDLDLYVSNMSSTAADRIRRQDEPPRPDLAGLDLDDVRRRMSKGNTLLENDGGRLREADDAWGARLGSWAWGTALFDYDADGDLDIHCLNGFWSKGADDGRDL